jgi:hypothetical protein
MPRNLGRIHKARRTGESGIDTVDDTNWPPAHKPIPTNNIDANSGSAVGGTTASQSTGKGCLNTRPCEAAFHLNLC